MRPDKNADDRWRGSSGCWIGPSLASGGIDRSGRRKGSTGDLLQDARRELALQLEELPRERTARVIGGQNKAVDRTILLAQSNPEDEVLALRVIEEVGIKNRVVVARDGVEALNYLFGTGDYEGRDTSSMPELILLDLKMPRLNGPLPVLILVSSVEERDTLSGLKPDGCISKPLDSAKLSEAVRRLKLR